MTATDDLAGTETDLPAVPNDLSALPGLTIVADPGRLACRLTLRGHLDEGTVPLLTACLDGWSSRGIRHVVVDMTEVDAVDASGARSLAQAAHVLGRTGGGLTLLAPGHLARGPLAASGLDLIESSPDSANDVVIGMRHVG